MPSEKVNVVLVGTKLDIALKEDYKRQVAWSEAVALAEKLNLTGVLEVSSKDG